MPGNGPWLWQNLIAFWYFPQDCHLSLPKEFKLIIPSFPHRLFEVLRVPFNSFVCFVYGAILWCTVFLVMSLEAITDSSMFTVYLESILCALHKVLRFCGNHRDLEGPFGSYLECLEFIICFFFQFSFYCWASKGKSSTIEHTLSPRIHYCKCFPLN